MANITIKKSTSYFMYVVQSSFWLSICKNNILGFSFLYDVNKDDVIIMYEKGKGFLGLCQTDTKLKKNNNKHICSDENLNKYYAAIKTLVKFDKKITVSTVFDSIKEDVIGFKNVSSFCKKYLSGLYTVIDIHQHKGKILMKQLLQHITATDTNTDTDTNTENTFISKKIKVSKEKLEKSVSSYATNSTNNSINNSTNDSETTLINTETTTIDTDIITLTSKIDMIPIMIIPCNNMIIPHSKKKKIKYILDHLQKCTYCEQTNNNNAELLSSVNDKCIISYKIVTTDDDILRDSLEAYHALEPYYLNSDKANIESNELKLLYINSDELYEDCILILWTKLTNV